jgi:hypothetical protein
VSGFLRAATPLAVGTRRLRCADTQVDKANNETDSSYLVVATGLWIVGKTVIAGGSNRAHRP